MTKAGNLYLTLCRTSLVRRPTPEVCQEYMDAHTDEGARAKVSLLDYLIQLSEPALKQNAEMCS